MLPLKKCRELLPADCSDHEVERLRASAYQLADVIVAAFKEKPKHGDKAVTFKDTLELVPPDERYEIEERAAILQFDAGLDAASAERAAFTEFRNGKVRSNGESKTNNGQSELG